MQKGFLPWLPEMLEDPYEVWLAFERRKKTGRIALRLRYIKGFWQEKTADNKKPRHKGLLFVADARAGTLNGWTMGRERDLQQHRAGKLIYVRAERCTFDAVKILSVFPTAH